MARKVRDRDLGDRAARRRLGVQRNPHWRALSKGRHLGYRRLPKGAGTWIARLFREGAYLEHRLGLADDMEDADGVGVLSFAQAQTAASSWFTIALDPEASKAPYTVTDALRDYLAWYRAHRKAYGDARGIVETHILCARLLRVRSTCVERVASTAGSWAKRLPPRGGPGRRSEPCECSEVTGMPCPSTAKTATVEELEWIPPHLRESRRTLALADVELAELSTRRIREWHQALADRPVGRRTRRGAETPNLGPPAESAEERRRRKVTANHILTTLKAALNHAFREGLVASDLAWRRVRPFAKVDEPRIGYLTTEESTRLVNACDAGFRELVIAALLTGCRYGELVKLRARDFDPQAGTVYVEDPKSGRPRHVHLNAEGVSFFEQVTAGRAAGARMFENGGEPWGRSHQTRRIREACDRAKLEPIGFHALRHTYGSQLAMKGVDLTVIAAQLGHADTRITQRHYAHLAPSYVAQTVQRALPKLGVVPRSKLRRLGSRTGS